MKVEEQLRMVREDAFNLSKKQKNTPILYRWEMNFANIRKRIEIKEKEYNQLFSCISILFVKNTIFFNAYY